MGNDELKYFTVNGHLELGEFYIRDSTFPPDKYIEKVVTTYVYSMNIWVAGYVDRHSKLDGDITHWDTSNVISMNALFSGAKISIMTSAIGMWKK